MRPDWLGGVENFAKVVVFLLDHLKPLALFVGAFVASLKIVSRYHGDRKRKRATWRWFWRTVRAMPQSEIDALLRWDWEAAEP